MRKNSIILITMLIVMILAAGCGRKTNSGKNMEQIQKEEGIPVRITEIVNSTYTETLTYNAVLSGIEEAVVSSMVGDVVTRINVKVGDYVKKDQVILTFPIDTPAAQFQQASSAYLNTKTTYERMQRLFAQGAISRQDMDNIETAYNVAQANYQTSQGMVNVKAPINGYMTNLLVNVGDKINPGDNMFTVSNTSKYKAVIWIPDSEIQKIKKGQKVEAKWNDELLTGYISSVAMAMDQNNKAFRAEIVFNTKTKYMASGVTVEISINTKSVPNTIVLDRSAMMSTGDSYFVWLVENNKAVKREIEVGSNNGIRFEVRSGLQPGDVIITEGLAMVYEGSLVKVIE